MTVGYVALKQAVCVCVESGEQVHELTIPS